MNPVEQRERFTAVQRIERRCDDVELIVTTIAEDFVRHRRHVAAEVKTLEDGLRRDAASDVARLDATVKNLQMLLAELESRTLWRRFRLLVIGR